MRALVTGASGFVASHLITHLHKRGVEVWGNSRRPLKKFDFQVHWLQADLTRFQDTLELIRESQPDSIYHLAAQTNLNDSWKDPDWTFRVNTVGSIFLLEAVSRFVPKARVLVISSTQVYGATFFKKQTLKEGDITNPISPYAGSKRLAELAALNFVSKEGLDVVIARAFNQVGTGQGESTVFPQFCRQVALIEQRKAPPVIKVGNLNVTRDFVHVSDAIRAFDLIMKKGKRGEVYNVGLGRGIFLRDVIEFLKKESRIPFRIQIDRSLFRKNDIPLAVIDPSKLKKLGWRPQKSVWDGLREVLKEWRQRISIN